MTTSALKKSVQHTGTLFLLTHEALNSIRDYPIKAHFSRESFLGYMQTHNTDVAGDCSTITTQHKFR